MNLERLNNFGYLIEDLSTPLKEKLLEEATYIQNNFDKSKKVTQYLAGHIEHEYELSKETTKLLESVVLPLVMQYDVEFDFLNQINFLTGPVPLCVEAAWINFQKKHEFNPIHNHNGIMSFVSWVKIPYNLQEEFKNSPSKDKTHGQLTSDFQFVYVNSIGQVTTKQLHVDKSFEGKIMLFPAKMMHCVYPFYTSNEYRISVAGNVMLKTT